MPEVVRSGEVKVQDKCDQMIAWGFSCQEPAKYLVKKENSPEYAIMCEKHRQGFERHFPNEKVVYLDWTLGLNQQFADEANDHWAKVEQEKSEPKDIGEYGDSADKYI